MTTVPHESSGYSDLEKAFAIFAKYDDTMYAIIWSEYLKIYAGPNPLMVSQEDRVTLEALGWHADPDKLAFYINRRQHENHR